MELKPVTLDENKLHELAEKYAIVLDCEFMAFIAKLLINNVKVRLSEYHHWENQED